MAATRFVLFALVSVLVTRSYAEPSSRILGGEEATKDAFPYAISLRLDNGHVCGGSIISEKHILTAAHCVTGQSTKAVDVKRLSVRVGSTNQFAGGKVMDIAQVTLHPDLNDLKNNLAILTLNMKLVWTDRIKSIPYAKSKTQEPPVGAAVTTAGWGDTGMESSTPKLQFTSLTVASDEVCSDAFQGNDDSIICLAHNIKQGSCKGDAGNGAVFDSTLVAVSNFVIGACGARYPDIYANVAHFASWIDSVLSQD